MWMFMLIQDKSKSIQTTYIKLITHDGFGQLTTTGKVLY